MLITVCRTKSGIERIEQMFQSRKETVQSLTNTLKRSYSQLGGVNRLQKDMEVQHSELSFQLDRAKSELVQVNKLLKTLREQKTIKEKQAAKTKFNNGFK